MARKPTERTSRVKPQVMRDHFAWGPNDLHITFPDEVKSVSPESDQHDVLWALEHVTNRMSFDEVMLNVAHYMADHPTDKLVPEAIRRVEQRIEHAT